MSRLAKRLMTLFVAALAALALTAVPARAGTITVEPAEGNEGASYKAYKIFSTTEDPDDASRATTEWASDEVRDAVVAVLRDSGATDDDVETAENAAGYIDAHFYDGGADASDGSPSADTLGMTLTRSLSGMTPTDTLTSGTRVSLSQGWWLIVTDKGQAATSPIFVRVASGSQTVYEKVTVPTVDKTVNGQKASSSCIGEALDFTVVGTVSSYLDGYSSYRYVFEDTPTNLAIDPSTVRVRLANGSDSTDMTPDVLGVSGDRLEVGFADLKAAAREAGATLDSATRVVLTYQAALTDEAVVGGDGNPNEVRVSYTRSPYEGGTGTTFPSTTRSYTYLMRLTKLDASDRTTSLANAGFTIQASDGRYVQSDGSLAASPKEFMTGPDGTLSVSGVGGGAYVVEETTAPQGYGKADPFTVTVTDNVSSLSGDANGLQLTARGDGGSAIQAVDAPTGVVAYSIADSKVPSTPETPDTTDGRKDGMGPLARTGDPTLYVVPGVMLAIAVLILVCQRRLRRGGASRRKDR